MTSAPTRYFAGRAPVPSGFHSDNSEDDSRPTEEPSRTASKPSRETRRRPRVTARVVSSATEVEPLGPRRGTSSGFVPVKQGSTRFETPTEGPVATESSSASNDSSESADDDSSSSEFVNSTDERSNTKIGNHEKLTEDTQNDFDDDINPVQRPVFQKPDLEALKRSQEHEARVMEEREEQRHKIRREEAKRLMAQVLREEEQQNYASQNNVENLPDDKDRPEDHDADYALWKVREILRIRRDREELRAWEQRTTATSRPKTKEINTKSEQNAPKITDDGRGKTPNKDTTHGKPAFMQKYYKVGPFFMEKTVDGRYTEEIYNRDYNQGTSEDVINRAALPQPLQARRGDFGRAGRSKYTHLAAEDTAADLAKELRADSELRESVQKLVSQKKEKHTE